MKTILTALIVALAILAASLFYGKTRFDAGFSAGQKQTAEEQTAATLQELKKSKEKAATLNEQVAALRLQIKKIKEEKTQCAEVLEIDVSDCLPE